MPARPLSTRLRGLVLASTAALSVSACLFETRETPERPPTEVPEIHPDLSVGNQWMYQTLHYSEYADGTKMDTSRYFIHYEIAGDSVIAGVPYRILIEEDLILYNTDFGLVKIRSSYALAADSSGIRIKALKDFEPVEGRFPFKAGAASEAPSSDTAYFRDEITALQTPLSAGRSWAYRAKGNPFGTGAATKTFLGTETLQVSGKPVSALKFAVVVENQEYIRTYEWYADGVKILSRSSTSLTFAGKDSLRREEGYLGKRSFTREDTLAVLKGTIFEPE
ncbi:MAG TPA: hypothetical protein VJ385_07175 [Fibrobacteria bacterium]|nr:hypothetical protein [Fibrobacteria bacterium]